MVLSSRLLICIHVSLHPSSTPVDLHTQVFQHFLLILRPTPSLNPAFPPLLFLQLLLPLNIVLTDSEERVADDGRKGEREEEKAAGPGKRGRRVMVRDIGHGR